MSTKFSIRFYEKLNGACPFIKYLEHQTKKVQDKIFAYLYNLATLRAFRQEPYSRQVKGKIRELKIESGNIAHRIFYFVVIDKNIIILHAFSKKTKKTPSKEINKALEYMDDYLSRF